MCIHRSKHKRKSATPQEGKKKGQEEVLDQEALKEDQNIRKDKNAEIGHMAGKDQVAVKKDQVAVKKDQEDQKNIDQ